MLLALHNRRVYANVQYVRTVSTLARSPLLRCPRADARKSYINAANEIKRVCAFVRDEYVFAQMVKVFGRDYSNEMTNVQCICV